MCRHVVWPVLHGRCAAFRHVLRPPKTPPRAPVHGGAPAVRALRRPDHARDVARAAAWCPRRGDPRSAAPPPAPRTAARTGGTVAVHALAPSSHAPRGPGRRGDALVFVARRDGAASQRARRRAPLDTDRGASPAGRRIDRRDRSLPHLPARTDPCPPVAARTATPLRVGLPRARLRCLELLAHPRRRSRPRAAREPLSAGPNAEAPSAASSTRPRRSSRSNRRAVRPLRRARSRRASSARAPSRR